MSTAYHARYFAHELTRQHPAASADRLSMSLFDACVDLNPHQIDAALFAMRSPLSKGVLLADEVGLGKTIEAGLVLCQAWAERRRRLLVVCPASLRKQWSLELQEKFNIPTVVLDSASYRAAQRLGQAAPFETGKVVITSMNFASAMQTEVRATAWDLVVIDEAHKLRNAFRPSNRMGQRIRWALEDRRKVLLTATPLQNSLLELYGLSTLIDERLFGDRESFQAQYMRQGGDLEELRRRLAGFSQRTLRNQVLEYVRYTERRAMREPFRPTDEEHRLYEAISAFLSRDDSFAIPVNQRTLTTLILRKLLASSSHAIAGTLDTMRDRLIRLRDGLPPEESLSEALSAAEELETEYADEQAEAESESAADILPDAPDDSTTIAAGAPQIDRTRLAAEITELEGYAALARRIGVDTKSRALLTALSTAFREMATMGANRKAVIFTESKRTQEYLDTFLRANGYEGKTVLFSGTNSGPEATAIYDAWVATNRDSGRASGSRAVDSRTALIEHFRDHADVMIATEAAAEGINLQFCSLVVNYDLPWNPQRIEQRIGRCHRYGQRHDVVVLNFLNERNEADRRVLELLGEKFNLFSGVFGASDDVIGSIESGVDFERRVLDIYQRCRTEAEIEAAFQRLREEMDATIRARIEETRETLLEHFDEDVHARLKMRLDDATEQMDRVSQLFWTVTRYVLRDSARFVPGQEFDLLQPPNATVKAGHYRLISKRDANVPGEFLYRLSSPLGEYVLETGKALPTPVAALTFNISGRGTKIADVARLRGREGWLTLRRLVIDSFGREEHLLFSAVDDAGKTLDQEACENLFRCDATVSATTESLPPDRLDRDAERHAAATVTKALESNNAAFLQERERLERWADDKVAGAERELADTKARIRTLNREARLAVTTEEQRDLQLKIRDLERDQRRKRQAIFDVEDDIFAKRDDLIGRLEQRMEQQTQSEELFTIRWSVV